MMTINETIQRLSGTPFRRGGRDVGVRGGIDCLGVVLEFFADQGVELPDPATLDPGGILSHALCDRFEEIDGKRATVGDVMRWDTGDSGHLAVIVSKGKMLHACHHRGVCVVRVHPDLKKRARYYRLRPRTVTEC